ncbi:MAG: hypothetical protein MJ062_06505 [Oscillospiraceae bacterium]|nr:hypothetical protein [Oscillospiraceae bacterium]
MDVSVFPMGMEKHIIFCAAAAVFLLIQFIRTKYWYELVLAVTLPLSLLVYVNDSESWFYFVGILEAVLLILAFVVYCIQYSKEKKKEKAAKAAAEAAAKAAAEAETEPQA